MILVIIYDLRPRRDPAFLSRAINALGPAFNCMECTWLLSTDSPRKIDSSLRRSLAAQDLLFVADLTGRHDPVLPPHVPDWIAAQLRLESDQARKPRGS